MNRPIKNNAMRYIDVFNIIKEVILKFTCDNSSYQYTPITDKVQAILSISDISINENSLMSVNIRYNILYLYGVETDKLIDLIYINNEIYTVIFINSTDRFEKNYTDNLTKICMHFLLDERCKYSLYENEVLEYVIPIIIIRASYDYNIYAPVKDLKSQYSNILNKIYNTDVEDLFNNRKYLEWILE